MCGCESFPEECFRTLGIYIQDLIKEVICRFPFVIFELLMAAHEQGLYIRTTDILYYRCRRSSFWLILLKYLLDSPNKILHEAELTHILRLQVGEFLRQVVGIHIAIGRDQNLFSAALFYQGQIPAPLILHPDCIEILRLGSERDHHFRGIKRRKDIRLIGNAKLILQRDP